MCDTLEDTIQNLKEEIEILKRDRDNWKSTSQTNHRTNELLTKQLRDLSEDRLRLVRKYEPIKSEEEVE